MTKDTHCSHCGERHVDETYPKTCPGCNTMTFVNPPAVAVAMVSLGDGRFVGVRRGVAPFIGELAFPGGYQNVGETLEQAAAREFWEETGIDVGNRGATYLASRVAGPNTLVFFKINAGISEKDLNAFKGPETQEVVILDKESTLCFPLHQEMLRIYA